MGVEIFSEIYTNLNVLLAINYDKKQETKYSSDMADDEMTKAVEKQFWLEDKDSYYEEVLPQLNEIKTYSYNETTTSQEKKQPNISNRKHTSGTGICKKDCQRKVHAIKPEVLAFLKKTKKKKKYELSSILNENTKECSVSFTGKKHQSDSQRVDFIDKNNINPVPQCVISKIANKKGSIDDLIDAANGVLNGKGKVNFIAVKGSGQVSKVQNGHYSPVPQTDSTVNTDADRVLCNIDQTKTTSMENKEQFIIRPYKCTRCRSYPFQTKVEMDFHISCHVNSCGTNQYQCLAPGCDVRRPAYPRLIEHIATKHPDIIADLKDTETVCSVYGEFTCDEDGCNSKFNLKTSLNAHTRAVHGEITTLTCSRCGITFKRKSRVSFNLHEENCKGLEYRCTRCDYKSNCTKDVSQHMKIHCEQSVKCKFCDKTFSNRARLKVHEDTHDENRRKYTCEICGGVFVHKDALKKHKRRFHDDVEKLRCPHCHYTSKMAPDMKKHILMVHTKVYHCKLCNYQTNNKKFWTEHLEYHAPEKVYACPYSDCYYKAELYTELTDHMTGVHKVGARHQCPICCKYFKKKTHLVRHLVSHTGEKVYKCADCSAAFMSHSSYYRHRNKTGHDKGREGVLSVPQNIIIQYQDDDTKVEVDEDKRFVYDSQINQDKIKYMYLDVQGSMHVIQDNAYLTQCMANTRETSETFQIDDISQIIRLQDRDTQGKEMLVQDLTSSSVISSTDQLQVVNSDGVMLNINSVLPHDVTDGSSSNSTLINFEGKRDNSEQNLVKDLHFTPASVLKPSDGNDVDCVLQVLQTDDNSEITFQLIPKPDIQQDTNKHCASNSNYETTGTDTISVGDQSMEIAQLTNSTDNSYIIQQGLINFLTDQQKPKPVESITSQYLTNLSTSAAQLPENIISTREVLSDGQTTMTDPNANANEETDLVNKESDFEVQDEQGLTYIVQYPDSSGKSNAEIFKKQIHNNSVV